MRTSLKVGWVCGSRGLRVVGREARREDRWEAVFAERGGKSEAVDGTTESSTGRRTDMMSSKVSAKDNSAVRVFVRCLFVRCVI